MTIRTHHGGTALMAAIMCATVTPFFPSAASSSNTTSAAMIARWPAERAWKWYEAQPWLVGVNYLPATAANSTEMWQQDTFDPETIDRELALAQTIGFNCARVFIQYLVWEDDPEGMKDRLDRFLSIASKHGIRTMVVLFDICNFSTHKDPYLGKQDEPRGVSNGQWTPSPGPTRAHDRTVWPKLEAYVKDIVRAHAGDQRVLAWEVWNEPLDDRASVELVEQSFQWAREVSPSQPVTATVYGSAKMQQIVNQNSDVISFHHYADAAKLESEIKARLAGGRPILCTEWLFRPYNSIPKTCLPVFAKYGVAAMHWGFVNGRTETHLHMRPTGKPAEMWQHDLFRNDLTPFDQSEIDLFKVIIKKTSAERVKPQ